MKKILGTVAAVAALTASAGANAALIQTIDLFTTPQSQIVENTNGGNYVLSQVGDALDTTILGGFRDLGANLLTGASTDGSTVAKIGVVDGVLKFSVDASATGTGLMRWDGANSAAAIDAVGLNHRSINPFGAQFELLTLFSDQGYKFVLQAYTDATHYSTVSIDAHSVASGFPGVASYIPLLAFNQCGFSGVVNGSQVDVECVGGGVNWFDLGALQAIIDPTGQTAAVDLTLNQVTVVPEPASLALIGLGLLGVGAFRRREKKQA